MCACHAKIFYSKHYDPYSIANKASRDHDLLSMWWLLKEPFVLLSVFLYDFFSVFLGSRTAWMFGKTPP